MREGRNREVFPLSRFHHWFTARLRRLTFTTGLSYLQLLPVKQISGPSLLQQRRLKNNIHLRMPGYCSLRW